ncbi:hypothetical protein EBN03_00880 [Nocardia stercoris]|uniref:ABM domain-containing protein n=1 Tax=Nocardia stercoris TaxID=2483361 RepID=A0A3M2LJK4_9NOCA|nr:hypothetical protein EBN03_00880 [Nocardia stercoris]
MLRDLVVCSPWKAGPAAGAVGPFMFSVTQFTPAHLGDVGDIWRAAERLGDQLIEIDCAVGVLTYVQPGRRRVGSLSVWADDAGLGRFVRLPDHVEIMNRYRSRGLPARSAKWWAAELRVRAALDEGLRMLDGEPDRRRVVRRNLDDPAR